MPPAVDGETPVPPPDADFAFEIDFREGRVNSSRETRIRLGMASAGLN